MPSGFDKKSIDAMNRSLRSLGESSRSWSNSLSQAFEKVAESQRETVDQARELEIAQRRVEESLSKEEEKRKSINKILEKQATYYKSGLDYLKSWEQRLKTLEKQTDSMLKKATLHFSGKLLKAIHKVGTTVNSMFSLKGAIKLLKVGLGVAIGLFTGLVATAKAVGAAIYKHISGAFKLVSSVVKTSAGYVVSFFRKIWDTITMGGGEIRQAVAEMAQAFGMFNKTSFQAMGYLQSHRREWYQMGLSVGEAAKYVIELNKAYGKLIGFGTAAKNFYTENIKMSRALGLEAEQSAKLSRSLSESNISLKDFAFSLVGTFGPGGPLESMGVLIPEVARDIADSVDQLALMSDENKKTFIAGAVWVRQYGFAIKDLSGIMDKFDTLSSAAENVSKLNQMFGVTINAMEMLVDTDPASRLEKVQQKLLQAGKSWESMDYFQRKSLASMMGINAEQAQLVFSGKQLGKSRKEIAKAMEDEDKKQKESQKRQAEVMSAILAQLRASRGIMGSIMPLFYRLWVAFGRVFKTFLWGARRGALDFVEGWTKGIRNLANNPIWKQMSKNWVVRWRETMTSFGKSWGEMWAQIDMEKFGQDFYGTIDEAIKALKQILMELFPDWSKSAKEGAKGINDIIHGIAVRLQGIIKWVGENGADIIKGIGRVAKGVYSIVQKVFNFFDKSNWGEAANIMKGLFDTVSKDAASILGYVDKTTGKMLTGFDPAVAAAKVIEKSYMSIRDLVIEINEWWKKNGDEVKNVFKSAASAAKPYFEFAMKTGKYVGSILTTLMKFLAKHPILLEIAAVTKATSFVTKNLFGLGLGQIASGMLRGNNATGSLGVQNVRVVNAAEIGMAAGGGLGGTAGAAMPWKPGMSKLDRLKYNASYYGGKALSSAGQALGFGALAYGGGQLAGNAMGGKQVGNVVGGMAGGAVAGGMIGGPIGAAIGGVIGGLWSFSNALDENVQKIRTEWAQAIVERLNKENAASMKFVMSKAQEQTATEMYVATLTNVVNTANDLVNQRRNEIESMQEKSRLDKEQRGLDIIKMRNELKQIKGRKKEDEEARSRLRERIRIEQSELDRRKKVNTELQNSIGNESYMNILRQMEIDQTLYELNIKMQTESLDQRRMEYESQLEAAKQEEQKKTEVIDREIEQSKLVSAQDWAKTGLPKSLEDAIKTLDFMPSVEGALVDQIERTKFDLQSGVLSPEQQAEAVNKLYSDIQTQIAELVDKGKFEKAIKLQDQIARNRESVGNLELDTSLYQLKVLKVKREAEYIRAQAEIGPPNGITVEEASARLASLSAPAPQAFGGLITKATNAILGEAGPELVVPMRKGPTTNRPGTETVVQDYLNKINPTRNRDEREKVVVVPINIDGRRLGEGLVKIAYQSI